MRHILIAISIDTALSGVDDWKISIRQCFERVRGLFKTQILAGPPRTSTTSLGIGKNGLFYDRKSDKVRDIHLRVVPLSMVGAQPCSANVFYSARNLSNAVERIALLLSRSLPAHGFVERVICD